MRRARHCSALGPARRVPLHRRLRPNTADQRVSKPTSPSARPSASFLKFQELEREHRLTCRGGVPGVNRSLWRSSSCAPAIDVISEVSRAALALCGESRHISRTELSADRSYICFGALVHHSGNENSGPRTLLDTSGALLGRRSASRAAARATAPCAARPLMSNKIARNIVDVEAVRGRRDAPRTTTCPTADAAARARGVRATPPSSGIAFMQAAGRPRGPRRSASISRAPLGATGRALRSLARASSTRARTGRCRRARLLRAGVRRQGDCSTRPSPCDDASRNLYFISNGRAEVKVDGKGVRKLQSPFMIGTRALQVTDMWPGMRRVRADGARARRGAQRRARQRLASARACECVCVCALARARARAGRRALRLAPLGV